MSDPVVLAPKLDLAAATTLLATLRARKEDEVVLDMSQVKHFGALCMQVILAVASDFASADRKLTSALSMVSQFAWAFSNTVSCTST